MPEQELLAAAEDHGPLQHVLELPHVALPRLGRQRPQRLGLDADEPRAQLAVEPAHEVIDQQRNVAATLAQRRQRDVHDVEPVEQVLAEPPLRDLPVEVAVGAGDDADVERHRPGRPHRPHLAVLDDPQQLDLEQQRQLADLVEEQGAVVGRHEQPGVGLQRAGEGAPDVAEELALDEGLGDGAAVDRDEGPLAPAGWRRESPPPTSSLPTPLSPVISTLLGVSAQRADVLAHRDDRRALTDQVMPDGGAGRAAGGATAASGRGRAGSAARWLRSARSTLSVRSSSSNGLRR